MSGSDYMEEKKTLDASGFDTWSSNYDSDVRESDKEERYPFAAYEKIMDRVCEILEGVPGHKLLDVGIGTGKLARKLMANGYSVTGVDFSQNMLNEAAQANPDAVLITWDFSKGLPDFIKTHDYSAVLCNYAIHHLTPVSYTHLDVYKRQTLFGRRNVVEDCVCHRSSKDRLCFGKPRRNGPFRKRA